MIYTIDNDLCVEIFFDGAEAPLIRQPQQPTGVSWADKDEASAWAEKFISDYESSPIIEEAPAE
jgi:hypothetical protein